MNKHEDKSPPYLRSLEALEEEILHNGYTEKFIYKKSGCLFSSDCKVYDIEQVKVISIFRFQGNDHPDNQAVLYLIETPDGTKGTFIERHNAAS